MALLPASSTLICCAEPGSLSDPSCAHCYQKLLRAVVSQACRRIRFPYSFLISFLENEQLYLFLWCNCKYYCWCSGVPCHRQIYLQEIYPLLILFICFLNNQGTLGGWTQFLWVFLLSKAQDPQVILLFARQWNNSLHSYCLVSSAPVAIQTIFQVTFMVYAWVRFASSGWKSWGL